MTRRLPLLVLLVVLIAGCANSGRRIVVEFKSAEGVKGQEKVLLGGQVIGRTRSPKVHGGLVIVPVVLQSADAIPDATIFILERRNRTDVVLVAYPRGNPLLIGRGGEPPVFKGVSSRAELYGEITKEEFGKLGDFFQGVFTAITGDAD